VHGRHTERSRGRRRAIDELAQTGGEDCSFERQNARRNYTAEAMLAVCTFSMNRHLEVPRRIDCNDATDASPPVAHQARMSPPRNRDSHRGVYVWPPFFEQGRTTKILWIMSTTGMRQGDAIHRRGCTLGYF
jgi:hypothetical protein